MMNKVLFTVTKPAACSVCNDTIAIPIKRHDDTVVCNSCWGSRKECRGHDSNWGYYADKMLGCRELVH